MGMRVLEGDQFWGWFSAKQGQPPWWGSKSLFPPPPPHIYIYIYLYTPVCSVAPSKSLFVYCRVPHQTWSTLKRVTGFSQGPLGHCFHVGSESTALGVQKACHDMNHADSSGSTAPADVRMFPAGKGSHRNQANGPACAPALCATCPNFLRSFKQLLGVAGFHP